MDRKAALTHLKFPVEGVEASAASVERIAMPLKRVARPFTTGQDILSSLGVRPAEDVDTETISA